MDNQSFAKPRNSRHQVLIGCGIGCAVVFLVGFVATLVAVLWLFGPSPLPDPLSFVPDEASGYLVLRFYREDAALFGFLVSMSQESRQKDLENLPASWRPVMQGLQTQSQDPRAFFSMVMPACFGLGYVYQPDAEEGDVDQVVAGFGLNAFGKILRSLPQLMQVPDAPAEVFRGQKIQSFDSRTFMASAPSGLLFSSHKSLIKEAIQKLTAGKKVKLANPSLLSLSQGLKERVIFTACLTNENGALMHLVEEEEVEQSVEEPGQGEETGEQEPEGSQGEETPEEPPNRDPLKAVALEGVLGASCQAWLATSDVLEGTLRVLCTDSETVAAVSQSMGQVAESWRKDLESRGASLVVEEESLESEWKAQVRVGGLQAWLSTGGNHGQ